MIESSAKNKMLMIQSRSNPLLVELIPSWKVKESLQLKSRFKKERGEETKARLIQNFTIKWMNQIGSTTQKSPMQSK
jgi:hypothetical protein